MVVLQQEEAVAEVVDAALRDVTELLGTVSTRPTMSVLVFGMADASSGKCNFILWDTTTSIEPSKRVPVSERLS